MKNGSEKRRRRSHYGGDEFHVGGNVNGAMVARGGIHLGDGNSGIVINSYSEGEAPGEGFSIEKSTRVPISANWIGTVSGLVTVAGFVTGFTSWRELLAALKAGNLWSASISSASVSAIAAVLLVCLGFAGICAVKFLKRHVLRLPKNWRSRAWAGVRDERGRTFPHRLRLAMDCPKCPGRRMRFQQEPAAWNDYPRKGGGSRREVTEWWPVAVCPRNPEHTLKVDVSGNDFEDPKLR